MRARSICTRPGCANLQPCQTHSRTDARPAWRDTGRKPYWQRHKQVPRALKLLVRREEPRCRLCPAPTDVVDHIVNDLPEPQRNSRANLQGLCRKCNTLKSANEASRSR